MPGVPCLRLMSALIILPLASLDMIAVIDRYLHSVAVTTELNLPVLLSNCCFHLVFCLFLGFFSHSRQRFEQFQLTNIHATVIGTET